MSIKKMNEAIDKIRVYTGINPYLLTLRNEINAGKNCMNDFNIEYTLANINYTPKPVNKIVKMVDWWSNKKKADWDIDFLPEKLKIISIVGETDTLYHVYAQFRMSVPPQLMFLPKNAVIGDFLLEDYHNVYVDFERYNNLIHLKDANRNIKAHQKEAVQFLLSRKKCILADDMGLGKSCELAVASVEGNFDSVLVICPASLKTNWKKELEWFVPEQFITIVEGYQDKTKPELEKYLGYGVGRSGKTVKELQEEAKEHGKWEDNRFVIVNYDILDEFYKISSSRSKQSLEEAMENSPMLKYIMGKKSLIIIDEAHKLSNKDSGRYKIIKNLIKRGNPDSVYLATGTPITNNPSNFYNILQLIEGAIPDTWEYFTNRYCGAIKIPAKGEKERWTGYFLQKKRKNNWFELTEDEKGELKDYIRDNARKITVLKDATNLSELSDRVSHIYLRRLKEDLNDLPGKTIHEVFYDLNFQQQAEYNRLWDEYEQEKTLLDPTKEINKDLLEGGVYRKYCSNQMVPYTIRLAENFINNGEKVIIACCYDEELYRLRDYFGDKCVVYNGKMTQKEKDIAAEAFLNDDSKMVFIGNLISAGMGLTLISSHVLIFNNIDFVPGNDRQMEDRVYRLGQQHDVDIYYQMFSGTQYEKMWNIVLRKELTINSVIKTEKEK